METRPSSGPRDVFLHLLAIIALYVSTVSGIALVFQLINHLFPDPLEYWIEDGGGPLRSSMAALIILFPVLLLTMRIIAADLRKEPEKASLSVRRWLLHLTLFIAAITIIIDLVTLVGYFLNGDLTVRFLLKVFTVLAVVGAVFTYELWELRSPLAPTPRVRSMAALGASALVLLALIGGFAVIGSPFRQRLARFDEHRIQDLQELQGQVIDYWTKKRRLPESIDVLRNDITGFVPPRDPATNVAYEYRTTGKLSFELCATFATEARFSDAAPSTPYVPPSRSASWSHGSGRTCFSRTIDPDQYPTVPQKPPLP